MPRPARGRTDRRSGVVLVTIKLGDHRPTMRALKAVEARLHALGARPDPHDPRKDDGQ